MSFRITGDQGGEPKMTTRLQAASAAVVAMRWRDEGVQNIRISGQDGRPFDIEGFRRRLQARPFRWSVTARAEKAPVYP